MAHFPPEFLDQVLSRSDIVEIISRHVQLKKAGSNLMGLCPFHHEKSPSFSVSPDKQLYYCFGCGKGGGAFQFLMEHDDYSFPEAVEYLAEKAGMEVPKQSGRPGDEERRSKAFQLLAKAAEQFSRNLYAGSGKRALDYFQSRGLPDEILRKYGLGFAPDGYGFMEKVFGSDARILAQLEAVGLLFKGERGYVDRFRGRVMFPIHDRRHHVVGFGGRIMGDGEPKYLNSPETDFFHKSDLLYGFSLHRDEIRKRKLALVVEGYMDVLMLAAHGLPVALAPLGTAMGERQVRELFRLSDSPVFCFDGDRAGRQAAWRALERMLPLLKAELSPRFLYLPDGEDPDSLVRKEGAEAFEKRIGAESRPVLETWLEGLKILAGQGAEGRARMAKKADAMLSQMQDDYLKQAWRQEVEAATGIRIHQGGAKSAQASRAPAALRRRHTSGPSMEEKFLGALIQMPSRFRLLPEEFHKISLDEEGLNALYTRAFAIIGQRDESNGSDAEFVRRLGKEFPEETRIFQWATQDTVDDEKFSDLVRAVESNDIERRLKRGEVPSAEEAVRLKKRQLELNQQRRG